MKPAEKSGVLTIHRGAVMKIGITSAVAGNPAATVKDLIDDVCLAENSGFAFYSLPNIFGFDAAAALTAAAIKTRRIELMSGVIPATPRHPSVLAQQALTAQSAAQGRFTLGLGISHEILIQQMLGLSYSNIVKQMSEYLAVLTPLLNGLPVSFSGEFYQLNEFALKIACAAPPKTLLAALGPKMLELAARYTNGTITWMAGTRTLASFIVPTLQRACDEHDKTSPRVVALLPFAVTNDKDTARKVCDEVFAIYGGLPVYQALMQREGANRPSDVAVIGTEAELRQELRRLRDAGVTDFGASLFPADPQAIGRTREFLISEIQSHQNAV
ncbi:MAG TPA: TIGR03564 family F420-dependent LLM class oxidoreductase [Spongiibacteraceae bacterium]